MHPNGTKRSFTVSELRQRRVDADRAANQRLTAVALLAACASGFLSMFFAYSGDACMSDSCGRAWLGGLAYVVTWGGIVAGVVLTLRGTSTRRGPLRPALPGAALALIVVTFAAGLFLASSVVPGA